MSANPEYVSSGTLYANATLPTSHSVSYPFGILAGDLLVLQCLTRNTNNNGDTTTPTGFSEASFSGNPYGGSNNARQQIYTKIATGSESGTLSVTASGGTTADLFAAQIHIFRPADNQAFTGTYIEGVNSASGTTTTVSPPSVNPDGAGRLAVCLTGFASSDATFGSFTGESNGDWIEVSNSNTTVGGDGTLNVQVALLATDVTISGGSRSFTQTTSAHWTSIGFALVSTATAQTFTQTVSAAVAVQKSITTSTNVDLAAQKSLTGSLSNDLAVALAVAQSTAAELAIQREILSATGANPAVQKQIAANLSGDVASQKNLQNTTAGDSVLAKVFLALSDLDLLSQKVLSAATQSDLAVRQTLLAQTSADLPVLFARANSCLAELAAYISTGLVTGVDIALVTQRAQQVAADLVAALAGVSTLSTDLALLKRQEFNVSADLTAQALVSASSALNVAVQRLVSSQTGADLASAFLETRTCLLDFMAVAGFNVSLTADLVSRKTIEAVTNAAPAIQAARAIAGQVELAVQILSSIAVSGQLAVQASLGASLVADLLVGGGLAVVATVDLAISILNDEQISLDLALALPRLEQLSSDLAIQAQRSGLVGFDLPARKTILDLVQTSLAISTFQSVPAQLDLPVQKITGASAFLDIYVYTGQLAVLAVADLAAQATLVSSAFADLTVQVPRQAQAGVDTALAITTSTPVAGDLAVLDEVTTSFLSEIAVQLGKFQYALCDLVLYKIELLTCGLELAVALSSLVTVSNDFAILAFIQRATTVDLLVFSGEISQHKVFVPEVDRFATTYTDSSFSGEQVGGRFTVTYRGPLFSIGRMGPRFTKR